MFQRWTSDELLTLAVIWLVLCGIVAFIAPMRGKSPVGAFLISVFASPLIGFLVVALGRPERQSAEASVPADRQQPNRLLWAIVFIAAIGVAIFIMQRV